MLKSIALALAVAAAPALPIAANATPNDGSGSGDGQMNKETCEALGGTYSPATAIQSYSNCYYPDGGVTTCFPWMCEYTAPSVVIFDQRVPMTTGEMAPTTTVTPSTMIIQRQIQTEVYQAN